ncbi:DUF6634 family protein [Methylobacterium haplocladii]|uniref:Uncharacterized protein n=1 Tax=Methylobacterium haplocladii TaxID=1176176 RepID=A0A512ISQ6_9HYPH|nr:DUF6634 family protein [Methylobacterium haplocladii]GEP00740.1 hypothetical protein MHA02_31270 [Methylobacterium haplocladii]GJD82433.1 hypothetical protein HPGCJGGD_0288 [Methylobacterium haplocladii]GLS59533.1 hypothetical protein GCM10007887_22020 [Methylobacterium haplocladii]
MPETVPYLASKIGPKLIIDDRHLRPAFFDAGSSLENGPLAAELLAIAEGREPTQQSLAKAPLLEDWWQSTHPLWGYFLLLGRVAGHPVLGYGAIYTSAVRAIALDLSWARTTSRFYRLGTPQLAGSPPSTTC